jgi:two-component system sensor histidine kinase KdpD
MAWPIARRVALAGIISLLCLAAGTVIVAAIDATVGSSTGSALYLIAVVASAYLGGTLAAILAAVGAPLLYNLLFIEPRLTLAIADPRLVVDVGLLLFVGIVVGQLAALQRSRAILARSRELEARALFRISRVLATRESTHGTLLEIIDILRSQAGLRRVWVTLGPEEAAERVTADSNGGSRPSPGLVHVLQRTPGDQPARWIRIHQPSGRSTSVAATGLEAYRVRIEAGGSHRGSIWGLRDRAEGRPDRTETRLMSAAADQIGQAIAQDQLAEEARAAELARRGDALQSALLQSVSHDLRTPLAAIRAAAGGLQETTRLDRAGRDESLRSIDRNVEHLDRLVTKLLDLTRIEGGALRPDRQAVELEDIVDRVLQRYEPKLATHPIEASLGGPPVAADPVLLDAVVTNLVENAVEHAPTPAPIRIGVTSTANGRIRLTVEDGGAGVPEDELPRLFDRFYRAPQADGGSRRGIGLGLAVVRGFTTAMGGEVRARRSDLGGLAFEVELPAAQVPTGEAPTTATKAGHGRPGE